RIVVEPVVEGLVARLSVVELVGAFSRVGFGLADEEAGHQRKAHRGRVAVLFAELVVEARADRSQVVDGRERRVVLVGPADGGARPPEAWSAVTTAFASVDGCRKVAGEPSVPSRSVVVRGASAAICVQASSEPARSGAENET